MQWLFQAAKATWRDAANKVLLVMAASAVVFAGLHLMVLGYLPADWQRPGSVPLHLLGLGGAILFILSTGFSLAKRIPTTAQTSPRVWFGLHVAFAWIGILLATVHASGRFLTPPALILALALGLMGLGVWARVALSARVAATFAAKRGSFERYHPARKDLLRDLIRQKSALLSRIDPTAEEALWSPTPRDWLRHPILTGRYVSLTARETWLIGSRRSVSAAQGYWRLVHILAALALVLGLAAHIIVVMVFPEYAARGRDVDWWHPGLLGDR